MSEWDAEAYAHVSSLQRWVAEKSLARVRLDGGERVLDLGCGDGKITAAIAARLPHGTVLGVDASRSMIDFATKAHAPAAHPNLSFQVADAARLAFVEAFDLIVSFNCLHWVHDQAAVLRGIRAALAPTGRTHLRFVSRGERRALEDMIEETRRTPAWAAYFTDYRAPYVHWTPEEYRTLAERSGLRVDALEVQQEAWDFRSRAAFVAFARATFVEWTRLLPAERQLEFIDDVLDRYRRIGDGSPSQADVFTFYQMEAELRRA